MNCFNSRPHRISLTNSSRRWGSCKWSENREPARRFSCCTPVWPLPRDKNRSSAFPLSSMALCFTSRPKAQARCSSGYGPGCTAHDVDPLSLSDTFRVINMPVNFRDPTFQQELRAIVDEMHPILIVPDTRARCTPGADENSSKDMGEVVNFCSQLQQTAAAVAFIHHPTKKDPSGGGRGSGDRPRPEAIGAALLRRWAGQICLSWTVPTGVNRTRARRYCSPAQQYRRPLLHKGTVQPSGGAGVMWKFGEQYPAVPNIPGTVPHESYPTDSPL